MTTLQELKAGEGSVGNGHSLPVYSEIEGETQKKSQRKRCGIIVLVIMLLLIGTIVGLSVGLAKSNSDSSKAAATTETSQSGNFGSTNENDSSPGSSAGQTEQDTEIAPTSSTEEEVIEEIGDTVEEMEGSGISTTQETASPSRNPGDDAVNESVTTNNTTAATTTAETRLELIIDYLVEKGIASKTDLESEGSYANQAVTWIANEDPQTLPVPGQPLEQGTTTARSNAGEQFVDRYVLAHIYYALGGPKWEHQCNFLSEKNHCEWMEVVDSLPLGVGCTPMDGKIRALWLNSNKLQNKLPSELGLLNDLVMLDLDLNFIQGTLPDSFQAMTDLEHLHMGSAGLEGTLPSWIGTLRRLESLNLGYNVMTGTLPPELNMLPGLRELALDNNAFEGDVNSLFSADGLFSLEDLFLDGNAFVGQLGEGFASHMVNLTQLDLSDNSFEGSVPEHFFGFPNLKVLDIHDNEFTSLPTTISENTALTFFAAHKNSLVGSIESIVNLPMLTHLDLSQNQLTGAIPESLGESMVKLTYLFLAENNFDAGSIPLSLSNLFLLQELSLKSTSRTGEIPNIMGMLTELVFLDLDNNNLQGTIPSTLGSLTNLEMLLLNRNNLVQEIPSEFGKLTQLETLFLEGNDLTAGLNHTCSGQTEIIAQCSLCDAVPGCCAKCCQEGEACNEKTHVADLDPVWQLEYVRQGYALDKENLWGR